MAGKKSGGGSKGPATFRDAGTGEFVTKRYAETHPKTTEKEHNKPPPKKK